MIGLIVLLMYAVFFIPMLVRMLRLKGRKVANFSEIKGPFVFAMIGVVFVTIVLGFNDFAVTLLWYRSIGFIKVLLTRVFSQVILYFIGLVASWAIYFIAFYVPERREELDIGEKIIKYARIFVPAILAFVTAGALSSNFLTILMYLNRVVSPVKDQIFNKPVSFYMFSYPFYSSMLSYLIGIFVVAFIIEELVYTIYIKNNFSARSQATLHATNLLSVLGGILFILIAAKIYISMYSLILSSDGAVFGVGYADSYARIPLFKLLSVIFTAGGIFLFVFAISPRFTNRMAVIKILISGVVIGVVVYAVVPMLFQYLVVKPNELAKEKQFLTYNIQGTRSAYGLDKLDLKFVNDIQPITAEKLNNEPEITDNLRFWDWRALKDTYQQIQSIRLYYAFNDIDVDRYLINGKIKEVMVSARELDHKLLPENSKTWVNLHLKYTHGYGICMNTVSEFSQEGLPNLLIKDVPPVTTVQGLKVTQPEIYFGELTDDYIFVNSSTPEFDYPKGEDNSYATYSGNRGIPMNPLNKLIFAINFDDPNIILSRYLNSNSKILILRNIKDRISKVAPFLEIGNDPYIVLGGDGKLYWMGDAFTYSSLYPYSEPIAFDGKRFNYFKNSVKYVVDTYTGDISFYIVDETDPLAQVYKKIFPTLFKDFSVMPDFLKAHIRYPDEMMEVQGEMYTVYHMNDPEVFYNKEDRWAIAQEKYYSSTQQVIPYYVILKNPEESGYEFASVYPFTPYGKNNLVALVIARCDVPHYGEVYVEQFPKEKLFYGPLQIEARIDQDSEISKVLTLWNQQGSGVIRGNTLVMPIENSLLYLEPVYLQASTGKFPQIKKIVLATQNKLVWGDTFVDAMNFLFGENYTPTPITGGEKPTVSNELIISAYNHFEKYKQYMATGDYDLAGNELKEVERILKSLSNP